jgi:hypothetical protein
MLRALVLALVLANVVFFAWTLGWLDGLVGLKASGDREPERLARQVNPDSVVLLAAAPAAAASAPACLESGPYSPGEVTAAESALRTAVPGAGWTNARSEQPGAWLVYMGGYPDRETLQRKIEEIGRTRVSFEEVTVPGEGAFGLSLGRYDDKAAADRALAQVQQRGIRTARVVQGPPAVSHVLRVEHAEPALAAQLAALKVDALGKGFVPCATR